MGLLLQCWGILQSFPPSGENSKLWVLSMPNCEPNTSIRSKWQKRGNIQETIIYRYWHWNWHLFSLLIEHILDTYWTHIYISVGFKSLRRRGLGFSTSKWFWHTTNEGFPYTNHIPLIFDVEQRSCSYACWQMAPVLPEHESSFHFCGTCQCPFAVGSVLTSAQFSPFWSTPFSCQALAPLLVFLPSWWRWPSLLSSKPILLLQLCPWVLSIPLASLSWLPHKLHNFVSLSGSLQATHHQATFGRPPLHRKFLSEEAVAAPSKACPLVRTSTLGMPSLDKHSQFLSNGPGSLLIVR